MAAPAWPIASQLQATCQPNPKLIDNRSDLTSLLLLRWTAEQAKAGPVALLLRSGD